MAMRRFNTAPTACSWYSISASDSCITASRSNCQPLINTGMVHSPVPSLGAESVAASGVSSEMVLNTVKKCEATRIWHSYFYKSGERFR